MSILKNAIVSALGTDVEFDERNYPASVDFCTVPRGKFIDTAKAMKKVQALTVED